MRPSVVLGAISASFLALVILGGAALTAANAAAAAGDGRPVALDALGVGWMFALWAAFAVGSVFFIAWVAEGMAADGAIG